MTKKSTEQHVVATGSMIVVARASNTTHDQLETLLRTPNPVVAIKIAQRPDLSTELAERLACDSRAAVRLRVAQNTSTPTHLLEHLQNDPSAEVRDAAAKTLVLKTISFASN